MSRDHDKEAAYEVGYGKPPHHTRFVKGQCGNPKGRPPSAKNVKTLLREALNEPVVIAENGRRRKITKVRAIIKQVVNRSAKGDWRGIKILLDFLRDIEGQTEPISAEASGFTEADEKVIEQLRARFSKAET
jgi:uncharacterized protein DUF5681